MVSRYHILLRRNSSRKFLFPRCKYLADASKDSRYWPGDKDMAGSASSVGYRDFSSSARPRSQTNCVGDSDQEPRSFFVDDAESQRLTIRKSAVEIRLIVLLLLFASLVFVTLVLLSAPLVRPLFLFGIHANAQSDILSTEEDSYVISGVWGYCTTDSISSFSTKACSNIKIGWSFHDLHELSHIENVVDTLTSTLLILHLPASLVTLFTFLSYALSFVLLSSATQDNQLPTDAAWAFRKRQNALIALISFCMIFVTSIFFMDVIILAKTEANVKQLSDHSVDFSLGCAFFLMMSSFITVFAAFLLVALGLDVPFNNKPIEGAQVNKRHTRSIIFDHCEDSENHIERKDQGYRQRREDEEYSGSHEVREESKDHDFGQENHVIGDSDSVEDASSESHYSQDDENANEAPSNDINIVEEEQENVGIVRDDPDEMHDIPLDDPPPGPEPEIQSEEVTKKSDVKESRKWWWVKE